jgi:hypothetical protein
MIHVETSDDVEEDESAYIVVTTVIFRDDRAWDTEVYIDVDDHAAFPDDHSLIAHCIGTLESSLNRQLAEE